MRVFSPINTDRSIRTKFGLVSAVILLGLLLVFYLGGRYILVHMIRQAERDIQTIGTDIKTIVCSELQRLQQRAEEAADESARSSATLSHEFLQEQLEPFASRTPVHLAAALSADGSFERGCLLVPGWPLATIDGSQISAYFSKQSPLTDRKSVV